MKILVLESSPNRHGSSNMLAGEFIRGAGEAGHRVQVVDVPTPTSIPAAAVWPAAMKDPARRRTTWKRFVQTFLQRICSFL